MNVEFQRIFEKDVSRIKDRNILDKLEQSILQIESVSHFSEIKNIIKMSGYKTAYRVRVGNYRIGLSFENNTIQLSRFLKRGDIYKKFP